MIKIIQKEGIGIVQRIGLALALLLIISNVNIASAQSGDIDTDTSSVNTCFNLSYNMRRGSTDIATSGDVTKLQQALIQLNYLSQDPSGYFGSATYSAVQRFQSANNLISSGYVGSYTRAAIQSVTCNNSNNGNTNNYNNISLTPSSLNSNLYDQDSSGQKLRGINFMYVDSNNYFAQNNVNVSITNTNIPSISVSLSRCAGIYGTSASGPVYANYSMGSCMQNTNQTIIAVDLNNSSLVNNTYYYFTIRINQNGSYVDKQYSFTYKKVNNNNNCTYTYQNGVYGCYYSTGPDVSTCQYTGYNNNCNTGGFNGAYYNGNTNNNSGYYYGNSNGNHNGNSTGYYTSDNTYILY